VFALKGNTIPWVGQSGDIMHWDASRCDGTYFEAVVASADFFLGPMNLSFSAEVWNRP
jgi:hypothetical protein